MAIIASSCKLGQKCGKCAENHNTDSCHQSKQNYNCVFSIERVPCLPKVYVQVVAGLSVPLQNSLPDKIDKLIAESK